MSGFQAYLSFFEHVKAQLSGICEVLTEDDPKPSSGAYLIFQPGVDEPLSKWQVAHICQARLVVPGTAALSATIVGGKKKDEILDRIRDDGTLNKYDLKADGTSVKRGVFNYLMTEETTDISQDPKVYEKILTFELYTNAKS